MIGEVICRAGAPVRLSGYANDFDRRVLAVQFSLDEGRNWTTYETPSTTSERNLYWTFDYVPDQPGTYRMLIRSVNEDGVASPTPARVTIVAS